MFNWVNRFFKRDKKEVPAESKNSPDIPEEENPETKLIPPLHQIPSNKIEDCYRVGYDSRVGYTTLTLISREGSITMSMSPNEVIRLMKMLGATLDDEFIESNDDFDD